MCLCLYILNGYIHLYLNFHVLYHYMAWINLAIVAVLNYKSDV